MADDPGVMGNLPRSRPGRRSEKRASGGSGSGGSAKPRKPAAAKASAGSAGAKPRAQSKPRAQAAKPRAQAKPREQAPPTAVRDERVEERQGQDPITAALRAGMTVADTGVKVLSKIVQRLPRP
jgi:hypothetical protein